jgi:DNA-binding SARP family transcriptional activator
VVVSCSDVDARLAAFYLLLVLTYRVLGPLEVERDGSPVRLTAPRQRATLAILLLHANRVVSVDELAEALYAGSPPMTAVTQVQRQISELRKALGPSRAVIETRPPGYVLRIAPDSLDLQRFERLVAEARDSEPAVAARLLREAAALWRGTPFADLGYEPFAQAAVARLEELGLDALEQRFDADLALGHHAAVIVELESLVDEHPFRERFAAQLMLALYRSGRQADALAAYSRVRAVLVDGLGLEPTAGLRELQAAILRQDPWLDAGPPQPALAERSRAVLAVANGEASLHGVAALAEPLAALPGRELILASLVDAEDEVAAAAEGVNVQRSRLAVASRAAAFASEDRAEDIVRLTAAYDVDLVVLGVPQQLDGPLVAPELASIFARSTADVAVVSRAAATFDDGVFVPFGGGDNDWAAAELGAWLARASGVRLTLVGTRADPTRRRRDASRLLAHAALAVQQVAGVDTAPLLTQPTEEGLLEALAAAGIVVVGVSDHWRRKGIGDSRRTILRNLQQPVVLVHRGLRPGGLAPRESATRFTWSIEASQPRLRAI